jgi:hypothetical protein
MPPEYELIAATVSVIIGVPITFYIKDYLIGRSNFGKFKDKLEKIAGLNAQILYPAP